MNFCACPISLLGLTIKYVRLNLTSFVCEYLTIIGWGYTECYDLSKSKILREPSTFFYYSNIKFIVILKSVSGNSGRRTAIFHTRVWLQLRMSRIWFAAKHNLTVLRVTRTLFAGSHLQVKWWAFGQWVHRIITFSIAPLTATYFWHWAFSILVLTVTAFYLPPESGERITLVITNLLAMTVFMLLVADIMPSTSEVIPVISIYFSSTLFEVCQSTWSSRRLVLQHFVILRKSSVTFYKAKMALVFFLSLTKTHVFWRRCFFFKFELALNIIFAVLVSSKLTTFACMLELLAC